MAEVQSRTQLQESQMIDISNDTSITDLVAFSKVTHQTQTVDPSGPYIDTPQKGRRHCADRLLDQRIDH